jgi:hypothetical protein
MVDGQETAMARHVARMLDGDAFSTAVVKVDVAFAAAVLTVAVAVHLVA